MKSDTQIRRAAVGDEAILAKLNCSVQDINLQIRPDQFKPTQVSELLVWYKSMLEKPSTRVWIAEADGNPIGYLLAVFYNVPETPFSLPRLWCEIEQIAVDPSWRARGLSREL